MNLLKTLALSIILVSCVAPRDKKSLYSDPFTNSSNGSSSTGSGSDSSGGSSIIVDDGNSSGSGSSGQVNVPSEIAHCKWSFDGNSGFDKTGDKHLGDYTICQSKTNSSEVYVQMKEPKSNVRVCVVPTHESNGRAIFLGEARCQFMDSNKKAYRFPLVKNRDYGRYQNFSINGVMVMKEETYFFDSPFYRDQISYDAFFICSINLDLHGDSSYCDAFKSKNEYVYKKF
ncbi:MAG: hypothetical protein BM556_16635 [Bacteriovorax sp. MedPE-SWde]|nr:MAG: hypothetical protein BM556_16635 [Bacteriovorax sp. MedPE-SWde]